MSKKNLTQKYCMNWRQKLLLSPVFCCSHQLPSLCFNTHYIIFYFYSCKNKPYDLKFCCYLVYFCQGVPSMVHQEQYNISCSHNSNIKPLRHKQSFLSCIKNSTVVYSIGRHKWLHETPRMYHRWSTLTNILGNG